MQRKRLNKNDAPTTITQMEQKIDNNDFIVSKTDLKGYITYCNRIFVEMSGYSIAELLGANHNLIRHPDMPRIAYKLAWESIKRGEEFFGFVKNLRKDGGYYWVFAYIVPDFNADGKTIGFTSFRRKPSVKGVQASIELYALLREEEERSGLRGSRKLLENILADVQMNYSDYIISLQRDNA
jgi:PAS domain S-box-containing protein